jgi:hypothetical protein
LRCSMHAYARPRQQGSQANTSEASRQAVVQSHTVTLSYLAEFADIASEYSIGLCAAQGAAYGLQRIRRCVLAVSF